MNLAIITARAGSKRIPGKNIKPFAGHPIIYYSIKAAIDSQMFDRVIVSTDSDEIAAIAEKYGAQAPFRRPRELSDDMTGTAEVLVHTIDWMAQNDQEPEYFCCIYPTAPFLQPEYLKKGYKALVDNDATTAFSVATFASSIFRALQINQHGLLKVIWNQYAMQRTQDLPEAYHDAGQFYWGHTKRFLKEKNLYAERAVPVLIPRYLVCDIDTVEDWETAEKMSRYILADEYKETPIG